MGRCTYQYPKHHYFVWKYSMLLVLHYGELLLVFLLFHKMYSCRQLAASSMYLSSFRWNILRSIDTVLVAMLYKSHGVVQNWYRLKWNIYAVLKQTHNHGLKSQNVLLKRYARASISQKSLC